MIYLTGDMHGDPARWDVLTAYGEPGWSAGDVLIICGDFGYIFADDEREQQFLDKLAEKPYTICFVDGNHENFPAIYRYPSETWNGGRIHRIRPNIIHLRRGQVFLLDGKTFFTMGGAYSVDRYMRWEGHSYWNEELPNNSEYREASANLKECGFRVDYILTHTAPREMIRRMGRVPHPREMELSTFLDWVMNQTEFRTWFFGHWHLDKQVNAKFRALYKEVVTID